MENNIINVLEDNFIDFAGESLINFLPSVCDGLLRSHRKVMYALYENGVTHDKPHIKMLRGSAMAMKYYVYGDMSLTQVMKNMGCNGLNYMYINPKGNFGDKNKKNGVGASPRYIECRLDEYAEDLLDGIRKNSVKMIRNFDNTANEPTVLPSKLPNILLNTGQSIATGESSKIPAHNLNEVCDAFISYIKTKNIDKSIDMLNGCDVSSGGQIIYDKETFEQIYKTGKGSFTLVGKYKYNSKENSIHIYEIPYDSYIEDIDDKLRELYDKGQFKEIVDIHDGSDKDGLNLIIYLKKNTDIDMFVKKLRKNTSFESKMSCNFMCLDLDCKTPILMNLETIITKWIEHRHNCITNELSYDITKKQKELKLLYALKQVILDLDKAINIVKNTNTDEEIIQKLMKEFNIDEEEANYVSEIKLRNMNKSWMNNKIKKIEQLEYEINELHSIINDNDKINELIISDLENSKKKYGKERMTEVIYNDTLSDIKINNEVQSYNVRVITTEQGYVKKLSLKAKAEQKIKDDDVITNEFESNNTQELLVFYDTDCYKVQLDDLADANSNALGEYLPTKLNINKPIGYSIVDDKYKYLLIMYNLGKIAKVDLNSFKTESKRKKLSNSLCKTAKVVKMFTLQDDVDIVLINNKGKEIVLNTSELNTVTSRSSQGSYPKAKKNIVDIKLLEII